MSAVLLPDKNCAVRAKGSAEAENLCKLVHAPLKLYGRQSDKQVVYMRHCVNGWLEVSSGLVGTFEVRDACEICASGPQLFAAIVVSQVVS